MAQDKQQQTKAQRGQIQPDAPTSETAGVDGPDAQQQGDPAGAPAGTPAEQGDATTESGGTRRDLYQDPQPDQGGQSFDYGQKKTETQGEPAQQDQQTKDAQQT